MFLRIAVCAGKVRTRYIRTWAPGVYECGLIAAQQCSCILHSMAVVNANMEVIIGDLSKNFYTPSISDLQNLAHLNGLSTPRVCFFELTAGVIKVREKQLENP